MRLVQQIGIVAETDSIDFAELAVVSAALQKQAVRDLEPFWEVSATVDAFASLDDVPPGYWHVLIQDDIGFDAAGIHLDKEGQPFALVSSGPDWSLTASHEVVEMLVNPFGNRMVAGRSPKRGQGRVEFLVEACDPSEASEFAYTVNGVLVSDFYTPRFFDPVAADGVRYSFTGAIRRPRTILRGGYISWHDPVSDAWFQETWFSGKRPKFRSLGVLGRLTGGVRSVIDKLTAEFRASELPPGKKGGPPDVGQAGMAALTAAAPKKGAGPLRSAGADVRTASAAKAKALRAEVAALTGKGK